ncbi:MAG: potassium transporter [Candidatus Krumholzibacteriota bacterium]|nr:potassium transporter [Candidatus Krumholzibacteriota bacterium]
MITSKRNVSGYRFKQRFQRLRPGYFIIISFCAAALLGAVLLSLPPASTGAPLAPVDALFTSTSAICVTGLIVVDTGSQFTLFGKIVILTLIQLGGLGVMTFSVFLFLFLGKGLGTRQRWIITESFTPAPIREISRLIKSIFIYTFTAEALGMVLLFLFWRKDMGLSSAFFHSLFHAVSAFCNAGFSFFSSSFIHYRARPLLNLTIMLLIVSGGLGFPVVYEFILRARYRRRHRRVQLSLHSRMVLWTTLVLILSGAVLIFIFENGAALEGAPAGERIFASFFQSVTSRTAGFNTLNISALGPATLFMIVLLMFVGASPGSCGGGVKTTSLAVLFAVLRNKFRSRDTVSLFNRTLPQETVTRALSVLILAILTVTAGLILLLITQMGSAKGGNEYFLAYLFETVSAFATVGLSMGITSTLTAGGKLILIILMLLGRVGLLTVAYVFTRRAPGMDYRYAEEKVMIG